MKNENYKIRTALTAMLLNFLLIETANAQDSPHLTKKQEKYLSTTKVNAQWLGRGTFSAFTSYLYAQDLATLHTESPEVANTRLRSLPDPNKEVTLRELFDEIARQTSSKWTYDQKRGYWLFEKPMSFEIDMAKGWKNEIRQGYIFYKPPTAPVGMDIYTLGRIDSSEAHNDARLRIAKEFAKPFSPTITADSMKEVSLPHVKALFYHTDKTQKGVTWRQWVIVEKGLSYVIVSAIKPNDEPAILPDVEQMVQSFRVIDIEKN